MRHRHYSIAVDTKSTNSTNLQDTSVILRIPGQEILWGFLDLVDGSARAHFDGIHEFLNNKVWSKGLRHTMVGIATDGCNTMTTTTYIVTTP